MICPKCQRDKFVISSGETHYICVKDPTLPRDETGCGSQFNHIIDTKINFPANVIFNERKKEEFYKKPYLELSPLGSIDDGDSVTRVKY